MKGSRIHGIVRELRNENIDIVNFTNNLNLYIQRSLTPAKVNSIEIDEKNKRPVSILMLINFHWRSEGAGPILNLHPN